MVSNNFDWTSSSALSRGRPVTRNTVDGELLAMAEGKAVRALEVTHERD